MESQKILNLQNEAYDSEFLARNWKIAIDQSNAHYLYHKSINV